MKFVLPVINVSVQKGIFMMTIVMLYVINRVSSNSLDIVTAFVP